MKEFFKSTLGIIITLAAVAVGAALIGNSQWLHNLLATKVLPDGTPCTVDGQAGIIINGVCQKKVGPGGSGGASSRTATAPNMIKIQSAGIACVPSYSFMGVDYIFQYRSGIYCYYKKP